MQVTVLNLSLKSYESWHSRSQAEHITTEPFLALSASITCSIWHRIVPQEGKIVLNLAAKQYKAWHPRFLAEHITSQPLLALSGFICCSIWHRIVLQAGKIDLNLSAKPYKASAQNRHLLVLAPCAKKSVVIYMIAMMMV